MLVTSRVVHGLTPDHVQEAQELTLDCDLSALSRTRAAHPCAFPVGVQPCVALRLGCSSTAISVS